MQILKMKITRSTLRYKKLILVLSEEKMVCEKIHVDIL